MYRASIVIAALTSVACYAADVSVVEAAYEVSDGFVVLETNAAAPLLLVERTGDGVSLDLLTTDGSVVRITGFSLGSALPNQPYATAWIGKLGASDVSGTLVSPMDPYSDFKGQPVRMLLTFAITGVAGGAEGLKATAAVPTFAKLSITECDALRIGSIFRPEKNGLVNAQVPAAVTICGCDFDKSIVHGQGLTVCAVWRPCGGPCPGSTDSCTWYTYWGWGGSGTHATDGQSSQR